MLPVNIHQSKHRSISASRSSIDDDKGKQRKPDIDALICERDDAQRMCKEWQVELASVKAELDRERGSSAIIIEQKMRERERDIRAELNSEWAKNEAGWRERIRNERLLRLSYERVLLGMGFTPTRIASDIVRVSRPQPLHEDPGDYNTINLLDVEAGLASQPSTKRKGLFAYSMDDIKATMSLPDQVPWKQDPVSMSNSKSNEFFPVSGTEGKRELLKVLATDEP